MTLNIHKSKYLPIFNDKFKNNLSKTYYQKILTQDLILKQNYRNIMQLPRIDKIVLNTTSKTYVNDKKFIIFTLAALELISGQKPQLTYARKSVANFKIRQHQILGCKVILRENLMYTFLDKLSRILLPRIRDNAQKNLVTSENFEMKSSKFLAYSFGLKNLMIFPELENHFELVENFRGINLTFIFSFPNLKKLKQSHNRSDLKQTKNYDDLSVVLSGFQIPRY